MIDRSQWAEFVDAFSRQHDGWLISVAVEAGSHRREYMTRDLPLRGVVAEVDENTDSMMVFTGDATHETHFVEHPVTLTIEETADGAEAELTIADGSGARTIVELRSAIRPELVDGMAR